MLDIYSKFYPKSYSTWRDSMLLRSIVAESVNIEPKAKHIKQITFDIITTTFNEEDSIVDFLNSVFHQTIQANSLIICDAGSSDKTVDLINTWSKEKDIEVKVVKSSNCSIAKGRNEAVKHSKSDYLLFADAGTSLNKNYSEQIIYSFLTDDEIDLVAGWYKPIVKNSIQKAFAWFVLPSIENVNPETFLPSARSMAVKKRVFDLVGGFPEHLSFAGEDTLFSLYAKSVSKAVSFNQEAFCHWKLPDSFFGMIKKIYHYSKGDGEIGALSSAYYLITIDKVLPIFIELVLFILLYKFLPALSYLIFFLILFRVFKLTTAYGVYKQASLKDFFFRTLVLLVAVPTQIAGFIAGLISRKKIEGKKLLGKSYKILMLNSSLSSKDDLEQYQDLINTSSHLTVIYTKFVDGQIILPFLESHKRSNFVFDLWKSKHVKYCSNQLEVIDKVKDSTSKELTSKFLELNN